MINQGAGSARHPLQQLVHPNRCNERRRHHHQGRFYEKIVAVPLDFVQITSPLP